MGSQFRNNKLVTASISPAAYEALGYLKNHFAQEKTSRAIDEIIKAQMTSLGYEVFAEQKEKEGMVTVKLISEGKALELHASDSKNYFEAPDAGAYCIRIENKSAARKEVVVSVDGLSVMDGEEAGYTQRGYILSAFSSIDIKGWRRTDEAVAAFEFSDTPGSYASKIGADTNNLGVIGVAVFDEERSFNHWINPSVYGDTSRRFSKSVYDTSVCDTSVIGTAYGKETKMKVTEVTFSRESQSPSEVHSFRYASRKDLIKWGVISKGVATPNPFPANKPACKEPENWKG